MFGWDPVETCHPCIIPASVAPDNFLQTHRLGTIYVHLLKAHDLQRFAKCANKKVKNPSNPASKRSFSPNCQSLTENFLHEGMPMPSVPRTHATRPFRIYDRGVEVVFSDGHVDKVDEVSSVQIQPAEFISRRPKNNATA